MYSSTFTSFSLPNSLIGDKEYYFIDNLIEENGEYLNYFNIINKNINYKDFNFSIFLNQLKLNNDNFNSRELSIYKLAMFYNYIDLISLYTTSSNNNIKDEFNKQFYSSNNLIEFHQEFFNELFNYCFSTVVSNEERINALIELIYFKEFYLRIFFNLNFGTFKKIVEEINMDNFYYNFNQLDYIKINHYIKRIINEFFSAFITTFNDQMFQERIKDEIAIIYKANSGDKIENESLLLQQVEYQSNELYKEYKKLFDSNEQLIIDFSNNIFLSKFLFLLSSCYGSEISIKANNSIHSYNEAIKPFIIASALFGFFSLKSSSRIDNFSNIFKETTYLLNQYLQNYYYYIDKIKIDDNSISLLENLKNNINSSYWIDKINLSSNLNNTESLDINKDYNFFYGTKIKNLFPEKMIEQSLLNSYHEESKETCLEFIKNMKEKFKDDDVNNIMIKWENLDINLNAKSNILFYPSLDPIMKNDNNNISDVMKKRIIGNKDPFNDFDKIANIINSDVTETIPDYNIFIKTKEFDNNNAGIYRTVNINKIISMNNLINLSISKNSTTKIKTAIVNFVDFNKELIEYYGDSGIGVLNSVDGKIELLKIEPGNEIEIYLGYSDRKTIAYKGFINKILFQNNILSIECVDVASSLYNYKIKNIKFNDTSVIGQISESINNIFKLIFSDGIKEKPIGYENFLSGYINDHLFNYIDPNSSSSNPNPIYNFGNLHEESSFYNVFGTLVYKMPYNVNNFFNSNSNYNKENLLITSMKTKYKLNTSFGDIFNDASSTSTLDLDVDMFSNINNIDRDYEVYGMYFLTNISGIDDLLIGNYDTSVKLENNTTYVSDTGNINIIQTPLIELSKEVNLPSESNLVTSIFGEYRNGGTHKGVDIANNKGLKLFSPMECRVIANSYSDSYGYYLDLFNDKEKIKFKFAHLESKPEVNINDIVSKGQEIGIMGNTGKSSGTHLHLEVFKNGERIDPLFLFNFKNFIYDWNLIGQTALKSGGTHALDIQEYKKMVLENFK
jgi:hypothetical protein